MAQAYVKHVIETDGRGDEDTTPTPSTKVYYTPAIDFNVDPGVSHLDRSDEVRNTDEPLSVVTEMKDPTWSLSSRLYPDLAGMLFWHLLGDPTTEAGDGSTTTDPDAVTTPVGTYKHTWTAPFGPTGAYPLTAEFEPAWEDQSFYGLVKGAAIESLSLTTPESGGARVEASGPALYFDDQSDPSLSPTYEALSIKPFLYADMSLPTWLSGAASTRNCSIQIEQPLEPERDLGAGSEWRNEMYRGDGPIVFTGSVEQALIDADDFDALMAATGFAATVRWVSQSIITGSYPYKLWIEFDNAQYVSGGPAAIENRRRIQANFDFRGTYDGSGASVTVTLVNGTSAYA